MTYIYSPNGVFHYFHVIVSTRIKYQYTPYIVFCIFTVQTVFFGVLWLAVTRMKYVWTPYMCVMAAVCMGDYTLWKMLLTKLNSNSKVLVSHKQYTYNMPQRHVVILLQRICLYSTHFPPPLPRNLFSGIKASSYCWYLRKSRFYCS